MTRKPEWVAWILQGLVGFAGGGILGFAMIVKGGGRRRDLIVDDQKSLFLFGIAWRASVSLPFSATAYGCRTHIDTWRPMTLRTAQSRNSSRSPLL
jgi:hypothetical protein